jgi:AraC family transcriptional regulator, regulatory protein of adaptative response / methylated-DNA-[protein]-cysteine methyltransferase
VAAVRRVGMLTAMSPTTATDVESTPEFTRVARAIAYLAGHAREQPSVAEVAGAAGWSEYHFARVFRQWAGISPKQLLQHLSLVAAKQALDDERSVLQAALDAGLSGPGRLHDLFVSLEAVTPGEYKSRGRGLDLRFGTSATPFGPARIAFSERGIAFLGFAEGDGRFGDWEEFRATWREARWEVDESAARRVAADIWRATPGTARRLTLWVHGTNFQLQVWRALLAAGQASSVSYSRLAQDIGRAAACRAVGSAVGANPVAWLIPCHHVLRANGALGGYRWGIERKQAMLAWEVARSLSASRPRRAASHASAAGR